MNAGDIFAADDVLAKCNAALHKHDYSAVWGDSIEVSPEGEFFKKSLSLRYKNHGMFAHHQSIFYSMNIVNRFEIRFDTSFRIASDYDFTLKVLSSSSQNLQINLVISKFERGGASSTHWITGMKEQFRVRRKNNIGVIFSTMVFVRQFILVGFRHSFPRIWDYLRYKKLG
jgi:hypothetical protein